MQEMRMELRSMLTVLLPMAARLDVLARMDLGRTAEHGDEVALATHLDAQHATMDGDALDQPR